MPLRSWINYYIADIIFWIFMFFKGADIIGDTPFSGIFSFLVTFKWRETSADGVKLFGWVFLFMHTIVFIIGLTTPEFRSALASLFGM